MSIERLGQFWPEWIVIKKLGEGAFGQVYKATREDSGVTVSSAIKVISIPKSEAELNSMSTEGMTEEATREFFFEIVQDFIKEIELMESLKGTQNIVSVEDFKVFEKSGDFGWDIFIRMELLTSFTEYLKNKKFPEAEVIRLGIDILKALELCSKLNIVHRDIKPENIFVSTFGDFKLGDFGIARELGKTSGNLSSKGALNYMAPEVASGGRYDATVDIYSLGIVLYKLLNNNRIPFLDPYKEQLKYEDFTDAIEKRKNGEPLIAPIEASNAMSQVILKACAYNPRERYQSPTEFKYALEAINASEASTELKIAATSMLPFSSVSAKPEVAIESRMGETVNVRQAPAMLKVDEEAISASMLTDKEKTKTSPILVMVAMIFLLGIFSVGAFFIFVSSSQSESDSSSMLDAEPLSLEDMPANQLSPEDTPANQLSPEDMPANPDDYDSILVRDIESDDLEDSVVRIIITDVELEAHPNVVLTFALYDLNNEAVTAFQTNGFAVYENDIHSEILDVRVNGDKVMLSYISPASFGEAGNRGIRLDYSSAAGSLSAFSAYILEATDLPRVGANQGRDTPSVAVPEGGGFILPHSSTRALTDADLNGLSAHQLLIARNEIFARHGRQFFDDTIQNHFNAQSWYRPTLPLGVEPTLSQLEQSNVALIQAHEGRRSEPAGGSAPVGGGFILPHSSTRALSDADLNGLSAHQLMIARNEIFARHGRRFYDQSIQSHFDAQSWYQPRLPLGVEPTLSQLEQSNVALIQAHEARR